MYQKRIKEEEVGCVCDVRVILPAHIFHGAADAATIAALA